MMLALVGEVLMKNFQDKKPNFANSDIANLWIRWFLDHRDFF